MIEMFFVIIIIIIGLLQPVIDSQWNYYDNRHIQCYSCTDCPEPFFFYHTQAFLTPPDVGQCMKTVVYAQNSGRRLISKGLTRHCIPEFSPNMQIYCCSYNLCNENVIHILSIRLMMILFVINYIFF